MPINRTHAVGIVALLALVAGCSNTESPAASTGTTTTPAAGSPSTTAAAGSPSTTAAPGGASSKTVDVCAVLSKEDAAAALGATISSATPKPSNGSLLGECDYLTATGLMTVSARPSGEFEATVNAYKDMKPVDGVGAKAVYSDKLGMMVSLQGKSYFVHILIVGGTKTQDTFAAVGKAIAAKA